MNWVKEKIGNWFKLGFTFFVIVGGLILINSDAFEGAKWGAIIMIIILIIYIWDDQRKYTTDEEDAKRNNPYIK